MSLANKTPTKEEIGYCIGLCLNHSDLRDKFCGINEELAQLGYKRVEVLNNALRYCKNDDKPNNVVYVPETYEAEIDRLVKIKRTKLTLSKFNHQIRFVIFNFSLGSGRDS